MKKGKQTLDEIIAEQERHFKFNKWDGKPFEHHQMNLPHPSKELLESPNYFEVIPSGEPCTKDNSLYLTIDQHWFDEIVSGNKTVEYREIKDSTATRYLELTESTDGYVRVNPNLPEDDDCCLEIVGYNEGIFPFTPRNFEYLRLGVGYSKDRDTAVIRIKGIGFVPEPYHKGDVWHLNLDDMSITDEQVREAGAKGPDAMQDLFYDPKGPHTYWTMAIHLGEVVELQQKEEK